MAENQSLGSEPLQKLTLAQIEFAKNSAKSDLTLNEAQKKETLEMFEQATTWLQESAMVNSEISDLESLVRDAPKQIQKLRSSMKQLDAENAALAEFIEKSDLAALELRISQEGLNLTRARDQQKAQLEELSKLLAGSKQINEKIAVNSNSLAQIKSDIGDLPSGEPSTISQARLMSLQARQSLRQAEIDLLKRRLGNQSLLTNLSQAQRDASVAQISRLQSSLEILNQAAATIREDQAKQARQEAELLEQQTTGLPLPLQAIAQDNAKSRTELE
ncbi:MAG: hypothetical protein KZQ79_00925, partial [Candidatus Thiodiazotropha sp. (ex Lucinoma borealis)]|nr:hypothetical protein [Candidatus Thiodiazotropha sp. (ex Lucinoma borealis)]